MAIESVEEETVNRIRRMISAHDDMIVECESLYIDTNEIRWLHMEQRLHNARIELQIAAHLLTTGELNGK